MRLDFTKKEWAEIEEATRKLNTTPQKLVEDSVRDFLKKRGIKV